MGDAGFRKHPIWGLLVVPLILGALATVSPATVRALCLVGAFVFSLVPFMGDSGGKKWRSVLVAMVVFGAAYGGAFVFLNRINPPSQTNPVPTAEEIAATLAKKLPKPTAPARFQETEASANAVVKPKSVAVAPKSKAAVQAAAIPTVEIPSAIQGTFFQPRLARSDAGFPVLIELNVGGEIRAVDWGCIVTSSVDKGGNENVASGTVSSQTVERIDETKTRPVVVVDVGFGGDALVQAFLTCSLQAAVPGAPGRWAVSQRYWWVSKRPGRWDQIGEAYRGKPK